jgi:hypothetical protein
VIGICQYCGPVGMGGIAEISTSAPGYNSIRPDTAAALAS